MKTEAKPLAMTRRAIEAEGAPLVYMSDGALAADSGEMHDVTVHSPDFHGLTIAIEAFRKAALEAGDPGSFEIESISESISPGRVSKVARLKVVPAHSQSVLGDLFRVFGGGERAVRVHLLADPHFAEWRWKALDERAAREAADAARRAGHPC